MDIVFILPLAIIIDLIAGDPPDRLHPVAWMGKVISFLANAGKRLSPRTQLVYGLLIIILTMALFTILVYFILMYLKGINLIVFIVISAIFLKTTFSLKGLRQAALRIKQELQEDDLKQARFDLRSLVSRDSSNLDTRQVLSATVESTAESSCDSFVAPLLYFFLFGVAGAVAYRVINTFDSMIGYHGEWEHIGKCSARLDDIVNFIPARISALLIVIAACIRKRNMAGAWSGMLRDHKKTESPNAGWTMSAMAGALGIQLEKAGHYALGEPRHPLSLNTIDDSLKILTTVGLIWIFLPILVKVVFLAAT